MGAAESVEEDRPRVVFQQGGIGGKLATQCQQLQLVYNPPIWARNPTVHMIASAATRGCMFSALRTHRQLVTVPPDGGTVSLDWFYIPSHLSRSASRMSRSVSHMSDMDDIVGEPDLWTASSAHVMRLFGGSRSATKSNSKDEDRAESLLPSANNGDAHVGGACEPSRLSHRCSAGAPPAAGGLGTVPAVAIEPVDPGAGPLYPDDGLAAEAPVVMVLHAFGGNTQEHYCRALCHYALQRGWRAVGLNSRGCGSTPLTSPRPFTAALTGDVYEAVKSVKERHPAAPVFLVGFSNGAYTVAKYLAEADAGKFGPDARVAGGLAADCGYDYGAEMSKIQTSRSCLNMDFLERHFWYFYCREHRQELNKCDSINFEVVNRARTVTELEAALICPAWGYDKIEDYYDDINSLRHIPNIQTPTLFMSAEDDLFLARATTVPPLLEAIRGNQWTVLAMTQRGSHCGYMMSEGWMQGRSLVDTVAFQFFDAILGLMPAGSKELLPPTRLTAGVCPAVAVADVLAMASKAAGTEHAEGVIAPVGGL